MRAAQSGRVNEILELLHEGADKNAKNEVRTSILISIHVFFRVAFFLLMIIRVSHSVPKLHIVPHDL